MDDLLLKRIQSLSPEKRKMLELYLQNKGKEDISALSRIKSLEDSGRYSGECYPLTSAQKRLHLPKELKIQYKDFDIWQNAMMDNQRGALLPRERKRIKVSIAFPIEDNTWDKFLKILRSGINSSPFSEILSPEVGVLFIELKNNELAEAEIITIFYEKLADVTMEKPEITIDDADQEAYRQIDDIPYAHKSYDNIEWNNSRHELKVELIRDDTAYLYNLHLCFILANKNLLPWYYQHYIQIQSWPPYRICNYTEVGFEYTAKIMERINVLSYRMLRHIPNIMRFIMDNIDYGNYLLIYVDEYYLPQKAPYNNTHFVHPSLVYGYDNKKRKILAIGFDKNMMINKIEFDFADFFKAYEKGKLYYMNGADEEFIIYSFKPRDFNTEYPFDLNKFLTELHNYIFSEYDAESEYLCKDFNTNVKFGIDAFDGIIQYMVNTEGKECICDYRAIHFIWEHKKGIYKRLEYITRKYNLADRLGAWLNKYRSVVELTQKARILFLQNSISKGGFYFIEKDKDKDKETIGNLSNILKQAKDEESRILLAVYYLLKYEYFSKPQFLFQKNIFNFAKISTSLDSGEHNGFETIRIELVWETPRTINRIRIMDSENSPGWRILGCLYFSDGSFINISDNYSNYGSMKEIKFEPKRVNYIRMEISGKIDSFKKLPEIQVFET